MRLTLINQFYAPDISPTAQLCASLAEHRAQRGDRVTVLTSRTGYLSAVTALEESKGVNVRRLWSTRLGSRGNLRRLLDWLTFYIPAIRAALLLPRQDAIIALTTPPFIAIAAWLHKLRHPGCRLMLWNMDTYPEAIERAQLVRPGGAISQIMRSINRAIFKRLDHLVCLDRAMADLLLSQYTPASGEVAHSIIPNWERAEFFPPRDNEASWQSPLMTDLRGRFVVLYLGNAGYGHEFKTLIHAASLMRDEPVTFLFVGGGALQPWIAGERQRLALTNIILHDYIPKEQTPALMRSADCALITLETGMLGVMSPSKLHANLAMHLPILYIGPQGGNVDEAISRFNCGISLRPGDGLELAEFIRGLMADRDKLQALKHSARNAFEHAYCDRQTLPQFDAILDGR